MIALLTSLAFADGPALHSGNTARTLSQSDSKLTVGVFRPLSIRVSDKTDLTTTGVLGSLLSPRLDVKHRLWTQSDERPVHLSFVGGATVPTPVLGLSKGWLYTEDAALPFAMMLKAGLLATRDVGKAQITVGAELRAGFAAGDNDFTPRDLFWYDWSMAPISEGPVVGHFKVQADFAPADRLLLNAELHLQTGAGGTEMATRLFGTWAASDHVALGLGWYTLLDQRPDGYAFHYLPGADVQLRY